MSFRGHTYPRVSYDDVKVKISVLIYKRILISVPFRMIRSVISLKYLLLRRLLEKYLTRKKVNFEGIRYPRRGDTTCLHL